MKPMKTRAAEAALDLHGAITEMADWRQAPQILEATVRRILPIDWLGLYYFSEDFTAYGVVTNPDLPFDWNEKYREVSKFDVIRQNTFRQAPGQFYRHNTAKEPNTDQEVHLLDVIKKHTDTSQFLTMPAGKIHNAHLGDTNRKISMAMEICEITVKNI